MTTVAQAKVQQILQRLKWFTISIVVLAAITFLTGPRFGAIIEGLTPPTMPKPSARLPQRWLEQNWSQQITSEFHHISQGTATIPIPLEWFLALEQASEYPLLSWLVKNDGFAEQDYLSRMGFIRAEKSENNPHNLPIGFATTNFLNIPGIENQKTAIGFTCAACHTGHFTYNNTEYVIEGGPAMVNLGFFTKAIGAALGQTAISANIPVFYGRFERFAKGVLKDSYGDGSKLALKAELESVVEILAARPSEVKIEEGSTRLDALNRIGNTVFAINPNRPENYVPINAPVNFPHIWTASWFDWVQYDGSIMQPLARNAGEALGVNASINTSADKNRFASSIPMSNLRWIEDQLSGLQPTKEKGLDGLLSPPWPDAMGEPDANLVAQGAALYQQHCKKCHLPTLTSDEIWQDKYFNHITWYDNEQQLTTKERFLRLNLVPISVIGTDPAQANVLVERKVNTSNTLAPNESGSNAMGIDVDVCAPEPKLREPKAIPYLPPFYEVWNKYPSKESKRENYPKLVNVPIADGPAISFALALGGLVQQTNDTWFSLNYIDSKDIPYFEGRRPNCLRASAAYKARPLNGVWATAPFLHNGSVPTLMDMLKPANERPSRVQLGSLAFDKENVGIQQDPKLKVKKGHLYKDGIFILDTAIEGNRNTGHEFSADYDPSKSWLEQRKGVIGPLLSQDERKAIIEFLKTL